MDYYLKNALGIPFLKSGDGEGHWVLSMQEMKVPGPIPKATFATGNLMR